jgi:hypothetical protein
MHGISHARWRNRGSRMQARLLHRRDAPLCDGSKRQLRFVDHPSSPFAHKSRK